MIFVDAFHLFINNFWHFMSGLGVTIGLSFLGVFFAVIFGTLICLANISKYKILRTITTSYIEIVRGVPLLLQLWIIVFTMPSWISTFLACLIAIVINSTAYVAEVMRGGIAAVDKGQNEAARSLGLNNNQAMFKVILPQAIKNILPSLANEFVTLIKETSLAAVFFVGDLMTVNNEITSITFDAITPFVVVAIMYFSLTFGLSRLIRMFERKLNY